MGYSNHIMSFEAFYEMIQHDPPYPYTTYEETGLWKPSPPKKEETQTAFYDGGVFEVGNENLHMYHRKRPSDYGMTMIIHTKSPTKFCIRHLLYVYLYVRFQLCQRSPAYIDTIILHARSRISERYNRHVWNYVLATGQIRNIHLLFMSMDDFINILPVTKYGNKKPISVKKEENELYGVYETYIKDDETDFLRQIERNGKQFERDDDELPMYPQIQHLTLNDLQPKYLKTIHRYFPGLKTLGIYQPMEKKEWIPHLQHVQKFFPFTIVFNQYKAFKDGNV